MPTVVGLILICLINSICCRTCIQSTSKTSFSLNSFDESKFKNTIYKLAIKDNVPKGECHLEITMNYTNHTFNVQFPRRSQIDGNFNEIRMTFLSVDQPLTKQTALLTIDYTCSRVDNCARDYLFKKLTTIISMDYTDVQNKLFQRLAKAQKGAISCFINVQSNGMCPLKLCRAKEKSDGTFEAACASLKNSLTEVNIISHMRNDDMNELIEYICSFDQCNDPDAFKKIKDTVRLFHQDLSKLFDVSEKRTSHPTLVAGSYTRLRSRDSRKAGNAIIQTKSFMPFSSPFVRFLSVCIFLYCMIKYIC